jgi:nicotinamide-nucleotide amidase
VSNDLAARVGERLTALGLRLALAESCTGGMLAARFTDGPGASRYLTAGLVTYSDAIKTRVLGVAPDTLASHGAVSEQVARQMLQGALREGEADAGVAITGVAGPGGGTPAKPVGTVWIAAAVGEASRAELYRFDGDRAAVREAAVTAALELLDEMLSAERG